MADSEVPIDPSIDVPSKNLTADTDTQIDEALSRKLLASSSLSSSCSSLHSNNSATDHDALENSGNSGSNHSPIISKPPLQKASPSDVLTSLGLPEIASADAVRSLAPAPFTTDAVAQQIRDQIDFRCI